MMQVRDLMLPEEILPCFDYTSCAHSTERLCAMLLEPPRTEAEVMERQAITKGFLSNWSVLENFTYRRLDLMEVHAFFKSIAATGASLDKGKHISALKLRFSENERNKVRSRLVQTVLLLKGISGQYLNRLDKEAFPESYRSELQRAQAFLSKLNLEISAGHIQEDRFTVSRMVEFNRLLHTLDPSETHAFWDFFFSFEAFWSIAKGSLTNDFTFPSFDPAAIRLEGFYHPVLRHPVKNNLTMALEENVLVLTGPNMSGKSTLLKAIGLCVYLARAGFTVPAAFCAVPFFSSIAIAININDSLENGYSHFLAEVQNLKSVVESSAGQGKCFAVFDEIFKGTNTEDALQIIEETVSGLARRKGSFFLISTHILQLKEQLNREANKNVKQYYIECKLDERTPSFSYRLKEGWSQLRLGKILFEKEGLTKLLSSKNH
jgi:DNA mismatch repair protein MutS